MVLPHFGGHIVKGNAALFELSRGAIAQGGMKAMTIAEDLDELEDVHTGLALGGIEALSHRVVEAVAGAPHARLDPVLRQPVLHDDAGGLTTVIGMVDQVPGIATPGTGHPQGIDDRHGSLQ